MAKLSKAQERTLQKIRERYDEAIERSLRYYTEHIQNPDKYETPQMIEHYKENLEYVKKGFMLWQSGNSRTLERLAEEGFIEYIKKDGIRFTPIDWVKLIK